MTHLDVRPLFLTLPEWPIRTVGVLAHGRSTSNAIPVSAPGARWRPPRAAESEAGPVDRWPACATTHCVALLVLAAEGNLAFTARVTTRINQEEMDNAPDYAVVEIDIEEIDDHRHEAFVVESGIDRRWLDHSERQALGRRVEALQHLTAGGAPKPSYLEAEELPKW